MIGLSFVASALLLVTGAQAQTDCSSLRKAISSYAAENAESGVDTSITTFNALLDVLGFDEAVISQFGSKDVLVPTDRAFDNFVSTVGGPDVDPMAFVMSHPNTFKQIVMYHFTAPMTGTGGRASTALASMDRLSSFIDTTAICGREDSKHVTIQFSAGETEGTLTLQEPVGKHFTATANTGDRICETPVTVTTVDTVLTPCPHAMTFPVGAPPGECGCMTVAMAAAKLSEAHPLGTLPYETADADRPVVASLKHPNLLMNSGQDLTVFLPTVEALEASGVTGEDFLGIQGALDHVVRGHVAQREVCIGGTIPAVPVETRVAADDTFCATEGTLTLVSTSDTALEVVADGTEATVSTTGVTNIAVCGGLMHVVDAVLMPCAIDEYSSTSTTAEAADQEAGEVTATSRGVDGGPDSTSGSAAVATGVAAAMAAAAAFLV